MAEEFQGGVCGGNWWTLSRNLFSSSPCSMSISDMGSFGWPNDGMIMDLQTACRSSDDSGAGSASDGTGSIVLQDVQKPNQLQMMGISLSSPATADDWNNGDLLHDNGRSQENYPNMIQETGGFDSSMNYQSFPLNSITSSTDDQSAETCQGLLPTGFPTISDTYSYTSSLLQTLFDTDSPPQQFLSDNQAMNYSSPANYRMNSSDQYLPGLDKVSPMVKPSFANQQFHNHFLSNNSTVSWNPASVIPSTQSNFLPTYLNSTRPNLQSFGSSGQNKEVAKKLASVAKKASNEPPLKRPRVETPSPLPSFKVRKERMGDRITALQQLVSPFGKTDTASVLQEAIEYIKFLHDQVSVLSTPYLKNGSPLHCQQGNKLKDHDGPKQGLRSRGLCLVPISSTFPVAAETISDFWTPTFGASFK